MAGKGSVLINFAAKADDALREVKKLAGGLDKVGDSADKSDSKFSKFKGAAVTGIAAVGVAVAGVGAAMIDFAKAAAEDAAAAENLANTLSSIPGITQAMIDANEDWVASMQIATGVADDDLRKSVSALALATGDLTKAQELTALAADVAAGSNKSLDSVTRALAKAVNGNTSALERQYPWLDKNKDGTVSLDEALEGLGRAYKGAAEKAADKRPWDRFLITMNELKETIGLELMPYLNDLSNWLKSPANQRALSDFAKNTAEVVRAIAGLVRILWNLVSALKSAWSWLDSVNRRWQELLNTVNRAGNKVFGRGIGAPSSTSYAATAAPTTATRAAAPRAYTGPVTINVNGAGDPYTTARTIKRALEGYDIGQGRQPWTPLAPAW